ncbi:hypothetical protein [Lacisediminihabitans sp.]
MEARPREIDEFESEISPRGSQVFFGVLDPDKLAKSTPSPTG